MSRRWRRNEEALERTRERAFVVGVGRDAESGILRVAVAGSERIAFEAQECQADGSIRPAGYEFRGSTETGWEVIRKGKGHLSLGPGYRLLEVERCGICSTDLARRFLPFRLPQITGHEVVARAEGGALAAVEINASHAARALPEAARCDFCAAGLDTHCPERLVLGIHDLPGGFGPWILAPVRGVRPLPETITARTATFVEPFAAALNAVRTISPGDGAVVAVVGVRKLGAMLVAALAAERARTRPSFEIVAIARRPPLLALARALGADRALEPGEASRLGRFADVAIDATGNPSGLERAIALARREVHVKSTTGRETLGLRHLTEFVVDEMTLAPWSLEEALAPRFGSPAPRTATVLAGGATAPAAATLAAQGLRVHSGNSADLARALAFEPFGRADLALVSSLDEIDAAVRPEAGRELGLVRARGKILVADAGGEHPGILRPILDQGLRFTSSRCGDFAAAIEVLADPATGLGARLGEAMSIESFPADRLAEAFARAADPAAVKVCVTHGGPPP